jgi:hypothetical protein
MRFTATTDATIGETRIDFVSNCYSDAFPLLRYISFRKQDLDLKSQSLPLACAILAAPYCGDIFEFTGLKIGTEYAEAIREILGGRTAVMNIDGLHRTISAGEVDVVSECASDISCYSETLRLSGSVPVTRVDWSGDFVDRKSQRSTGFAFGTYQTNAEYFVDRTAVSVAIALLHARDKGRNIYVPVRSPEEGRAMRPLQRALRIVGLLLQVVEPGWKTQLMTNNTSMTGSATNDRAA